MSTWLPIVLGVLAGTLFGEIVAALSRRIYRWWSGRRAYAEYIRQLAHVVYGIEPLPNESTNALEARVRFLVQLHTPSGSSLQRPVWMSEVEWGRHRARHRGVN